MVPDKIYKERRFLNQENGSSQLHLMRISEPACYYETPIKLINSHSEVYFNILESGVIMHQFHSNITVTELV